VQARITEIEDRLFGALSARLGVDNVREHMDAHSAQREAAMEQKMKMAKQVRHALAIRFKPYTRAGVMLRGTDTGLAVCPVHCCVHGLGMLTSPLPAKSSQHNPYVQAAKLTSSLDYQKRNDLQTDIAKLEQQIKDDKKRLTELEKARHALKLSYTT